MCFLTVGWPPWRRPHAERRGRGDGVRERGGDVQGQTSPTSERLALPPNAQGNQRWLEMQRLPIGQPLLAQRSLHDGTSLQNLRAECKTGHTGVGLWDSQAARRWRRAPAPDPGVGTATCLCHLTAEIHVNEVVQLGDDQAGRGGLTEMKTQ